MHDNSKSWLVISGGVLGGFAASTCCILPLVFFSLGVSGAWIGNLTALSPFQPYFMAVAVLFLGFGYYYVYRRRPEVCDADGPCNDPIATKTIKFSLWAATGLVIIAGLFPYISPFLFIT